MTYVVEILPRGAMIRLTSLYIAADDLATKDTKTVCPEYAGFCTGFYPKLHKIC